jgi:hypothetical protein
MSIAIAALALGLDQRGPAAIGLVLLGTAAALEAGLAFCLGCRIHAGLARLGLVRECVDCADLGQRLARDAERRG